MTNRARGTFAVQLQPQEPEDPAEEVRCPAHASPKSSRGIW